MATLQYHDNELREIIEFVKEHPGETLNKNDYFIKQIDDHPYPLLLRRIKFFSNVQQKSFV